MKPLRYVVEAFFTLLIYAVLRAMPLSVASAFGGRVAQKIGPLSKVHQVAVYNLSTMMPELSETERRNILHDMWNHLGRIFGEYPHLPRKEMVRRLSVAKGMEHFERARQSGRPVLFISGHIGNWELLPVIANHLGMSLHLLYRPANNPVVDWLIGLLRKPYSKGLYAKGSKGARAVIKAMQKGESVAMLVDQKTNDAIAVPFFGHNAMTTTAVAQFVIKYNPIVLPTYCVRKEGARFEIHVDPPMEFDLAGENKADHLTIMTTVNTRIEQWIRTNPSQWFWVHKRWPHSKRAEG